MSDARQYAPATQRNRDVILDVLRPVLPARGLVLEVASGTGEHVVHLAGALPGLAFQPTDPNPEALASIEGWIAASGVTNVRRPLRLDATAEHWPAATADAVLCINMIHIAPWAAAVGLFAGASRILAPGAPLYLYGPYRRGGAHTAPSNEAFDQSLKTRDPAWGVRDLEAVIGLAAADFTGPDITEMPANNLSLVFRRR